MNQIIMIIVLIFYALPMAKILHFSRISATFIAILWLHITEIKTGSGYWFLWESCELWYAEFTDYFSSVSSSLRLKAVHFFYPIGITWRIWRQSSLFETSVKETVMFAYIMTFHFHSELLQYLVNKSIDFGGSFVSLLHEACRFTAIRKTKTLI